MFTLLTTSGHFRAFIILFNCEAKLIVKISFLNTVHPLSGAYLVQTHLRGGGVLNSDGGLIREGEEFLQFSEDGGMGSP